MLYFRNLLLVLGVFYLFSCQQSVDQKEEIIRPVRYEIAGTANGENSRTFSGVAKASNELALSFRAGGIITKANVKVGDRVSKGSLIARLDNIEASLALEKSISSLNSARSEMNTAKNELERIETLYEKNSVSLSDYQAASNTYETVLAQYESAKRNKSIQETQVSYGYIYAPADGVIADTDGSVGENVSSGHQFAKLNAGDGIRVEVGIPENVINEISLGMKVSLTFSAFKDQTFEGSVIEIGQVVDESAATYTVKLNVINPDGAIRPGMAATVFFRLGTMEKRSSNTIVVPIKAVGEDKGGNYVFIVETEDGKTGSVVKKRVTVGEILTEGFEITDGLSKGDLIVTAGLQVLLDGQKVNLQ